MFLSPLSMTVSSPPSKSTVTSSALRQNTSALSVPLTVAPSVVTVTVHSCTFAAADTVRASAAGARTASVGETTNQERRSAAMLANTAMNLTRIPAPFLPQHS